MLSEELFLVELIVKDSTYGIGHVHGYGRKVRYHNGGIQEKLLYAAFALMDGSNILRAVKVFHIGLAVLMGVENDLETVLLRQRLELFAVK